MPWKFGKMGKNGFQTEQIKIPGFAERETASEINIVTHEAISRVYSSTFGFMETEVYY